MNQPASVFYVHILLIKQLPCWSHPTLTREAQTFITTISRFCWSHHLSLNLPFFYGRVTCSKIPSNSHQIPVFYQVSGSKWVDVPSFATDFGAFASWGFFAVYDGHGGALAAEHCEAELHKVWESHGIPMECGIPKQHTLVIEQTRGKWPLTVDFPIQHGDFPIDSTRYHGKSTLHGGL